MTHAERRAIEQVTTHPLSWRPDADSRFVRLQAGPCPLLADDARCSVYAVRPMNCRRYQCGRDGDEPWSDAEVPVRVFTDRDFRRQYALNERHAQQWGRQMGWPS
jgi:Fe-S-cluster containining protein